MIRLLFPLILLCCCFGVAAQQSLAPDAFLARMKAGKVQLLDVRTINEFHSGALTDALQADWLNRSEFTYRISFLDKNKPVLLYCASGVRSGEAARWLRENGFSDVSNLAGGMIAWKKAGNPVALRQEGVKSLLSVEAYRKKIQASEWVLVDVGAAWCPPCRQMEPVIRQLQQKYPNLVLLPVEAAIDTDVMSAENVTAIPSFILYRKGKEVWRRSGIVPMEAFAEQLK